MRAAVEEKGAPRVSKTLPAGSLTKTVADNSAPGDCAMWNACLPAHQFARPPKTRCGWATAVPVNKKHRTQTALHYMPQTSAERLKNRSSNSICSEHHNGYG